MTNNYIFDQWMIDLRSGEFKQGYERLCSRVTDPSGFFEGDAPKKHCCLGVLADQGVASGDILRRETSTGTFEYRHKDESDDNWAAGLPTDKMMEWAGIPHSQGVPGENYINIPDTLAGLNDNQNKSFREIADWAEANIDTEERVKPDA